MLFKILKKLAKYFKVIDSLAVSNYSKYFEVLKSILLFG
jgi:hypothetical protein